MRYPQRQLAQKHDIWTPKRQLAQLHDLNSQRHQARTHQCVCKQKASAAMVEFRTRCQYNKHLQRLLESLPQMIPDLVHIVQDYCILEIVAGMHLDFLDTEKMWLEAGVVEVHMHCAFIHYIGYSARWNEWVDLDSQSQRSRLVLVHTFTPADEATCLLP